MSKHEPDPQVADARVEELMREIESLREAVRARDDFLSTAAHELRNPMGAFVLAAEAAIMLAKRSPNVPPAIVDRLELLRRNINQFVNRATTLLDVSRIGAGQIQIDYCDVDYVAVARRVVENHEGEAHIAHVQIKLHAPPSLPGQCDPLRLEQIIGNLVTNAIKYGGGKPVSIRIRGTRDEVLFFVRDRGIGIAPADQARIFERFVRAVKNSEHGGFGVGLWIVRQIVTALGGEISVRSRPGRGSVFRVRWPKRPGEG